MHRTMIVLPGVLALALGSCSKHGTGNGSNDRDERSEVATVRASIITVDGSSTVFPITEAVAEEFGKRQRAGHRARVTIGVSGSGGGFKKLCQGEIDVSGASRPIKPTEVAGGVPGKRRGRVSWC